MSEENKFPFLKLPKDVVTEIYNFLNDKDKIRLIGTNKQTRSDLIPIQAKEIYEKLNFQYNGLGSEKESVARVKLFIYYDNNSENYLDYILFKDGIFTNYTIDYLITQITKNILESNWDLADITNQQRNSFTSNLKHYYLNIMKDYIKIVELTKRPKELKFKIKLINTTIIANLKVQIFPVTVTFDKLPNYNENDILFH
jgi:hypothetical protein